MTKYEQAYVELKSEVWTNQITSHIWAETRAKPKSTYCDPLSHTCVRNETLGL